MENFIELKKQLTSLEDDLINLETSTVITGDKKEIESIIKENIFLKSAQVFRASKEESAYWDYCSFSVFSDKYQEMLKVFLMSDNKDHNKELFIELELSKYKKLLENFEKKNYSNEIKPALEKKISFLLSKSSVKKDIEFIEDYSDTNAKEKIVFLRELGILDFLWGKYPNLSNNKIAEVLSAITNVKASTIQSYTNPIYAGKSVSQEKNPMTDEELVLKVKMKLIRMKILDK